jgi:hypothetical protein
MHEKSYYYLLIINMKKSMQKKIHDYLDAWNTCDHYLLSFEQQFNTRLQMSKLYWSLFQMLELGTYFFCRIVFQKNCTTAPYPPRLKILARSCKILHDLGRSWQGLGKTLILARSCQDIYQ